MSAVPPVPGEDAPPATTMRPRRPARLLLQMLVYLLGVAILIWYARSAFRSDEFDAWAVLRDADWRLVLGMLAFSLGSLFLNGMTFWLVARPLKDVGFWNMQFLNAVGNALNYLPLRPGLIARLAYHMRVDRLSLLEIGAWFASVAAIMLMVVGVLVSATLLHGEFDAIWIAMVLVGCVAGGLLLRLLAHLPLLERFGRASPHMLKHHAVVWPAIVLRLLDVVMHTGRLACAMAIVGVELYSPTYVVLVAMVALMAGLLPVRIGFREVLLGMAATAAAGATVDEALFALLALVESAGEALLYIPLGAIA
ncbi:MAG: hypothetical protein ACR2GY_05060, partial [Phycisphaerales bacterium]